MLCSFDSDAVWYLRSNSQTMWWNKYGGVKSGINSLKVDLTAQYSA